MDITKFNEAKHAEVIKAYLIEKKSHRVIQEKILKLDAPPRGGGFIAMEILHYYNINGSKKGFLESRDLDSEIEFATGNFKRGLEILRKYCS
ncbi:hypothetical protein [Oceanobacillus kapialis]|uniref:hypothetical protein n=1 Tax=Oceanobacillus kapialis TaxID=481353 RepID=UPI00384B3BEE